MHDFQTIDDLDVHGKKVLLRADLNVPMSSGKITDDTRITRILPTIKQLLGRGARVIVMSHFDRPRGAVVPELSLRPVGPALSRNLQTEVTFVDDCVGTAAQTRAKSMSDGEVTLLENLRFHGGEESNDPEFAAALAALGDVYVNDAFSASHRAHASIDRLAKLLPAAAGRLMQAEIEALGGALEAPARPLIAVIGGAKISTKLDLLANLSAKVDFMAIGGGMANTFLYAKGVDVGKSLCERDLADTAREVMNKAEQAGCEILLPEDVVVASALEAGVDTQVVPVAAVPEDKMILDIGPAAAAELGERVKACKSLVWNGPLGAFETPPFDVGTGIVARIAAQRTRDGELLSVAGGGDTVAALSQAGVLEAFSYVSTAGGAFLEWLEGKELPGVAALSTECSPPCD